MSCAYVRLDAVGRRQVVDRQVFPPSPPLPSSSRFLVSSFIFAFYTMPVPFGVRSSSPSNPQHPQALFCPRLVSPGGGAEEGDSMMYTCRRACMFSQVPA